MLKCLEEKKHFTFKRETCLFKTGLSGMRTDKRCCRLYLRTTWDTVACCIDSHSNQVQLWTETHSSCLSVQFMLHAALICLICLFDVFVQFDLWTYLSYQDILMTDGLYLKCAWLYCGLSFGSWMCPQLRAAVTGCPHK